MAERLAALSVDLDEIPNYYAIHGLRFAPGDEAARAVYARAVPRFRALFAELGVPCTFFVIGQDMSDPRSLAEARLLAASGHELANHTQNHRYDLTRMGRDGMKREVSEGIESVAKAFGRAPAGFRAPGYTITDELFDVLSECGVAYDSSVFPCPAYWAAKTAMIAFIRARGRRSHSVVDTPAVLAASADPYRVGEPYWRRATREGAMIELPVGVTRGARLPYIGTSVMGGGAIVAKALTAQVVGRPLVNLELHGADLLGAREDGLEALAKHQPDLRVSVESKARVLRSVVEQLRGEGYRFVTLFEAARVSMAAEA
jgi:peptidoglycan/xylan/chitin deacetylase (PgdA/CDA1 family)